MHLCRDVRGSGFVLPHHLSVLDQVRPLEAGVNRSLLPSTHTWGGDSGSDEGETALSKPFAFSETSLVRSCSEVSPPCTPAVRGQFNSVGSKTQARGDEAHLGWEGPVCWDLAGLTPAKPSSSRTSGAGRASVPWLLPAQSQERGVMRRSFTIPIHEPELDPSAVAVC